MPRCIQSYSGLLALCLLAAACEAPTSSLIAHAPASEGGTSVAPVPFTPYGLERGLVAHYTVEEGRGQVLHDRGGRGFDGYVTRGQWQPGVVGRYALDLQGQGRVAIPRDRRSPALDVIGALRQGSIAVWFRYDGFGQVSYLAPILYFGNGADPRDTHLIIEVGHPAPEDYRKLYFTIVVGGELVQCFDSNARLQPGQWYHFVAVVGPNFNTGYLNGQEMKDRHYSLGDPTTHAFFATLPQADLFSLGYGGTLKDPRFSSLVGRLDEVRLYNRPLGANEVLALYQQGGRR